MAPVATDSPFAASERQALLALAAALIPASGEHGVPSAGDPSIAADILATANRYHAPVAAALAMLEALARARHGRPLADLDDGQRAALTANASQDELGGDAGETFAAGVAGQRTLLGIVAQCYYRDDRVMRSLGMEPRPPFPDGFDVDQGDWSLLDPVKRRGRMYREAP